MQLFSGSTVLAALLLLAIEATDGQQAASTVATSSGPVVENLPACLRDAQVEITAVLVTTTESDINGVHQYERNLTVVVNQVGNYQHLFSYAAWNWIGSAIEFIKVEHKSSDEFDLLAATADPEKQQGLVSYGEIDFYVMRNSTPLDVLSFYRLDQFTGEAAGKVQAFVKDKKRNETLRKSEHLCLQFDEHTPPANATPFCVDTGEGTKTQLVAGFYSPKTVLVLFFSGKQKQVRVYETPIDRNNLSTTLVYQYEDFIILNRKSWWDFLYYLVPIGIAGCCACCCWCCCCRNRSQRIKMGTTKSVSSTGKKSKKRSRLSSTGTRSRSRSRSGTSSTGTTART